MPGQWDRDNLARHDKEKISEEKLVLAPLSTSVLVSEKPLARAGLPIGTAELGSLELKIYIRSSNTQLLSSTEKTRKDAFVAMYWILEKTMTGDARKANCVLATCDLEVSVGNATRSWLDLRLLMFDV